MGVSIRASLKSQQLWYVDFHPVALPIPGTYSLVQQVFIEHLLWTRHRARSWGYKSEQN